MSENTTQTNYIGCSYLCVCESMGQISAILVISSDNSSILLAVIFFILFNDRTIVNMYIQLQLYFLNCLMCYI